MTEIITFIKTINLFDYRFISAIAIFFSILLLSHFLKKIFFPKIMRFFEQHNLINSVIITKELRKISSIWFFLLATYTAIIIYPLPTKYLNIINKTIAIIAIFSVTILLINISGIFIKYYSTRKKGIFQQTTLFDSILKVSIFATGSLIIMQSLGISIAPILTALGVGGLAVALALQDTLSNFFAGFQILASNQVSPGDYIKLDTNEEGYVVDITWRNTTIRSLKNNIHVIPNAKMSSTIITNYYQPQREMSVLVQVGVSYDSDLEKVEKITIATAQEVLKNVDGAISDFEPFIRYHTFADFSINFTVILRVSEFVNQYLVKHEFVKSLHKAYKANEITIPFPIRTIINK